MKKCISLCELNLEMKHITVYVSGTLKPIQPECYLP